MPVFSAARKVTKTGIFPKPHSLLERCKLLQTLRILFSKVKFYKITRYYYLGIPVGENYTSKMNFSGTGKRRQDKLKRMKHCLKHQ